jgi:serine/threonine protein kinase
LGKGASGAAVLTTILDKKFTKKCGSELCVIKKFRDILSPKEIYAFWQEVYIMSRLQNDANVAHMYGYFSFPRAIVMEYYSEGSLSRTIHRQGSPGVIKLTTTLVAKLSLDVARGLRVLHLQRIAHCDIKVSQTFLEHG